MEDIVETNRDCSLRLETLDRQIKVQIVDDLDHSANFKVVDDSVHVTVNQAIQKETRMKSHHEYLREPIGDYLMTELEIPKEEEGVSND